MSQNNNPEVSQSAKLIVSGQGASLYETFKDFQRSNVDGYAEKLPDSDYGHPEIAGFIASGALVQVWRNRNRQNSHLMAIGDLETGDWDYSELTNVKEGPYEDYSKLEGYASISGVDYRLKASSKKISLTEWTSEAATHPVKHPVKNYLELDSEVYHETKRQRAALMGRVLHLVSSMKPTGADLSVEDYKNAA